MVPDPPAPLDPARTAPRSAGRTDEGGNRPQLSGCGGQMTRWARPACRSSRYGAQSLRRFTSASYGADMAYGVVRDLCPCLTARTGVTSPERAGMKVLTTSCGRACSLSQMPVMRTHCSVLKGQGFLRAHSRRNGTLRALWWCGPSSTSLRTEAERGTCSTCSSSWGEESAASSPFHSSGLPRPSADVPSAWSLQPRRWTPCLYAWCTT